MHSPWQILWEKFVWRPELVWGIFLYKSFEKSPFGSRSWPQAFCKSSRKSSCGGWSWIEAFSFTNPLGKGRLEAGAGLMMSWTDAFSFTNPLGKARLEVGAWLVHFPSQILWGKLVWRLQLVWGEAFEKSLFGGWSWFDEYFSFPRHILLTVLAKSYDSGFQTQF